MKFNKIILTIITLVLVIFLSILAKPSTARNAVFQGIGDLPGGIFYSLPWGLSENGSTVVGHSNSNNGISAFIWTRSDGIKQLKGMSEISSVSRAVNVSADGSIVVGYTDISRRGTVSFCWRKSGKPDLFQYNQVWTQAYDVSADGNIVTGYVASIGAFFWTIEGGAELLGNLPGGKSFSTTRAISSDGSTIVGYSESGKGDEAFRWRKDSGMEGLGDLPGGKFFSFASGVSADGKVVVGNSWSENSDAEAFRWTKAKGMQGIGDIPGGRFWSAAYNVSGDGSIVVGISESASDREAFIWDSQHGMRSLKQLLNDRYNLDLTGWKLTRATNISDNGLNIIGQGINPDGNLEGWIVRFDRRPDRI